MNTENKVRKNQVKNYKKPDVEIIAIDYKDVITTSACDHVCDPFWESTSH